MINKGFVLNKIQFKQRVGTVSTSWKTIDKTDCPNQIDNRQSTIDNRQNFRATESSPDLLPVGRQVLIDILEGQSQWKRHIFALFSKSSFAGLGALWVRQALFSKIFEKFENFRILSIPWSFPLDKNSLTYWKVKVSEKSLFPKGGGTFLGKISSIFGDQVLGSHDMMAWYTKKCIRVYNKLV